MRRRTVRRLARACALSVGFGLLCGCATHPPPPISPGDLQLAEEFPLYTTFWVGRTFRAIPLTAADSKREYDATVGMRVYYGNCLANSSILSTAGCRLPLEIATVLYRPHTNEGLGARHEIVIRGVPAEVFNGGSSIELYTGHLAIDVYAANPALALAAANALMPLNHAGSATENFALPSFDPGADPRVQALADRLRAAAAAVALSRPRKHR
jgi:hypothetical protein